jgi:hypothetical protein
MTGPPDYPFPTFNACYVFLLVPDNYLCISLDRMNMEFSFYAFDRKAHLILLFLFYLHFHFFYLKCTDFDSAWDINNPSNCLWENSPT